MLTWVCIVLLYSFSALSIGNRRISQSFLNIRPDDSQSFDESQKEKSLSRTPDIHDTEQTMMKERAEKPSAQTPTKIANVICLTENYGGHSNKILQLANLLEEARTSQQKVGLNSRWSKWYRGFFDPRDDVLLDYRGNCSSSITASTAHKMQSYNRIKPELMELVPKLEIRQEAEKAIPDEPFISVHRRWLEGQCHMRANVANHFCVSKKGVRVENTCDITYSDILNPFGHKVVLFTDGQQRKFDSTFPHVDDHSFHVQMWMMTLSTVHYGNPVSSVDMAINHWRKGREMRPTECFPPITIGSGEE